MGVHGHCSNSRKRLRRRRSVTMPVETRSKRRFFKSRKQGMQLLLPGIPDDITLHQIAPKVSWKDCHTLSSVSRSWRDAIRTHQVYDARVRAQSTETFVVHIHGRGNSEVIALYCLSDNRCYELPQIPHFGNRIPQSCQCIALDGKIYVIGGDRYCIPGEQLDIDHVSAEVFVLDVVGQRGWKQCASMQEPRLKFGCGIFYGKIYVFAGMGTCDTPAVVSEVYDPKVDAWSPLLAMPSYRYNHQVATIGEELFVYGGEFYDREVFAWDDTGDEDPAVVEYRAKWNSDEDFETRHPARFLEVYHPAKNEWRVVEPFGRYDYELLFMANGKFHYVGPGAIAVCDVDKNSWTNRYEYPFAGLRLHLVLPRSALAVNGELFVRFAVQKRSTGYRGARLLRSKGFSSDSGEIAWQKTSCSHQIAEPIDGPPVMCSILL